MLLLVPRIQKSMFPLPGTQREWSSTLKPGISKSVDSCFDHCRELCFNSQGEPKSRMFSDVSKLYLSVSCTFFSSHLRKKCESVKISIMSACRTSVRCGKKKKKRGDFLGHRKCDKGKTFHNFPTYWALPTHTTVSDLEYISRSQQCQTLLTENFMFSSLD